MPSLDIYKLLEKKDIILTKPLLKQYLYSTQNTFLKLTDLSISSSKSSEKHINPLLWQIGHVVFFYIKHVCLNLKNYKCEKNYSSNQIDFYDSYLTPLELRNGEYLIEKEECLKIFNNIVNNLVEYINENEIGNIESYLIFLGVLHNEMHNEAFIFTNLNLTNILKFNIKIDNTKIIEKIEFINYNGGTFKQGWDSSKDYLIFDNEMPNFSKSLDSFKISKYPITEYQFLQFVIAGGYQNRNYWDRIGWSKKYELPLYWFKNSEGEYFKKINNEKYSVKTNKPIVNISYYEAKAYCKWKGVRLPTESEWEYVATNSGTTLFPWGDQMISENANLNYKHFIQSVHNYDKGENNKGVSQLIGNVWEWCEEAIYPYDNFKIDPVYREMSYPFFGFKKICRGGCFAVPQFLIHSKYRNAQYPDCRIQFIGFRVCI